MADSKHRDSPSVQPTAKPKTERRRLSRVVHDHKGTATVQWYDAPDDYERVPLELQGAAAPAHSHDPYMRIPEADRKRVPGQRTDLRRLSAWIKMMRSL